MVSLRVEGLRKSFPGVVALDGIDLNVGEGEYVVILGPTGAGKTTLLKTIAGLAAPGRSWPSRLSTSTSTSNELTP